MTSVLIITYYWPPSGGAGVQRWLRFSKHLSEQGWDPIILTIDPEYATYPNIDNSLVNEVPPGIKVYKTKATDWFSFYNSDKTKIPSSGFANKSENSFKDKLSRFIRGNFFIPDPRRGWNRYAFKEACKIIDSTGLKYVITTSPPHSTQLIGLKIKAKYPGIKWIADLRDPWTDIYYYDQFYPSFLSKKIDSWYENKVLQNADKITTVGESLKASFLLNLKDSDNKIEVITNGYDEDDFKMVMPANPSIFTITYVGTISEKYPLDGLLEALSRIRKRGRNFLLRFVGTVPGNVLNRINSKVPANCTEFIPYTDHEGAIRYMVNSSMLLLVIPEHINNKNVITGKIFEYIASGKPILCIGPEDGDAAAIIKHSGSGICADNKNIDKIESYILSVVSNPDIQRKNTDEFAHKNIVKKLVSFIR